MFDTGVSSLVTTGLRTCCAIAVRNGEGTYLSLVHADDTTSKEDVLELARGVGLTEDTAMFTACSPDPHWKETLTKWQLGRVEDRSSELALLGRRVVLFVSVTRKEINFEMASFDSPDASLGGQLAQLSNLWNVLLHEQRPQRFGRLALNTEEDIEEVLQALQGELEGVKGLELSIRGDDPMKTATWSKFNAYFQSRYGGMGLQALKEIAKGCCHPKDYEQACRARGRVAQLKALKLLLIRTQTMNAARCLVISQQPEREEEMVQRCKKWLGVG